MPLLDLPSRDDVLALSAKLDQLLARPAAAAAPDAQQLLTLDDVAAYTQFNRRTVRKWVTEGQYGLDGRRVYLPALTFDGLLRFRRGDVEAFGLKVGVLTPAAQAPPAPTKQASPRKKRAPVASESALKVA